MVINPFEYLDEIIALIIVVGCLTLIGLGIDTEIKGILGVAAGWAFKGGLDIRRQVRGG